MISLSLFIPGRPRQKGNHKAFCPKCRAPAIITENWSNDAGKKLKQWVETIVVFTSGNWPFDPLELPVSVDCIFYFEKPKTNKDPFPSNRRIPDGDKLMRAVGDALAVGKRRSKFLSGVVIDDDCRIVDLSVKKRWCDNVHPYEGMQISVEVMSEQ